MFGHYVVFVCFKQKNFGAPWGKKVGQWNLLKSSPSIVDQKFSFQPLSTIFWDHLSCLTELFLVILLSVF